jgi:hypothetical protein
MPSTSQLDPHTRCGVLQVGPVVGALYALPDQHGPRWHVCHCVLQFMLKSFDSMRSVGGPSGWQLLVQGALSRVGAVPRVLAVLSTVDGTTITLMIGVASTAGWHP